MSLSRIQSARRAQARLVLPLLSWSAIVAVCAFGSHFAQAARLLVLLQWVGW